MRFLWGRPPVLLRLRRVRHGPNSVPLAVEHREHDAREQAARADKVAVEVDIHFCRAPYTSCNMAVT